MSYEMKPRTADALEEVKTEFGGHSVDCNYLDRDFEPNSITDIKLSAGVLCKTVSEKLEGGPGIMTIKEEFDFDGNHCETHVQNIDEWNVGPEMNDMGIETKPCVPLYNLYPMDIKEEVNDRNREYFDHSSVILENLKTETEDVDWNCEDPLGGGEEVALRETPETYFQELEQSSSVIVLTGHESKCHFCKESYSGELEKICEKCSTAAPVRIEDKMSPTGDKKKPHECKMCEKKPIQCDTCGKSFDLPSRLRKHKVCHSEDKPFKCKTCGKGFARNGDLTSHKRIHSGERPYLCEECGKRFVESTHLTNHKLTHTGQKPHKCDDCTRSFLRSFDLTRHKKIHAGRKERKEGK